MYYLYLVVAVAFEVAGTSALKLSQGMTRPIPVVVVVLGFGISFYLFSLVLQYLPVGVVYAIWSGLGIVLVDLVGVLFFRQRLDWHAIVGMVLILTGVVMMSLFSNDAHS